MRLFDGGKDQSASEVLPDDQFADNEYKAIDVACGPSFVFCVARKENIVDIPYEDKESKTLAKKLAAELKKEG